MPLSDIVNFSPHRAFGTFSTLGGGLSGGLGLNGSEACDFIKTALLGSNWQQIDWVPATGYVQFFLNIPTITSGIYDTFAIWLGYAFYIFNPFATTPPLTYTDPSGRAWPVVGVPAGTTPLGTLENVANAMSIGGFIGTVSGTQTVILTAQSIGVEGTKGNNLQLDVTGIGICNGPASNATSGGGWVLQSTPESDTSAGGNTAYFNLTVATIPNVVDGLVQNNGGDRCTLSAHVVGTPSSQDVTNYTLAEGNWMVISSDYDVYFFTTEPFGGGDLYLGNNTFWCVTPLLVPSSDVGLNFAAFVTLGEFQEGPYDVAFWVAGDYLLGYWGSPDGTHFGLSLNIYRFEGPQPVTIEEGQSVLMPAIVSFTAMAGQPTTLVGYIANAFVDTAYDAPYDIAVPEGITFRAISGVDSYLNTTHTLWLASAESNASGTGNLGVQGNGGFGNGAGNGVIQNSDNTLSATPNPLNLTVVTGQITSGVVTVSTSSQTPISITCSITGGPTFTILMVTNTSVSVAQSVIIQVQGDATSLVPGTYTAVLDIEPDGGLADLAVTVNLYVNGAGTVGSLSGIVSIYGPTVYWISGDHFDVSMIGNPIVIAGQTYIVQASGFGPNVITVSPAGPDALQNVPYNT